MAYSFRGYLDRKQAEKEVKAKKFSEEEERRSHDNRLRALLLFLPNDMSTILRYVYLQRSHAAYIPCDNEYANKLYENHCLDSDRKNTLRAWGKKETKECFYYKIPKDIELFLNEHIKELGEKWGLNINFRGFGVYQRAGKALTLE